MSTQEHPRYLEVKTAMLVHVPFFSHLLFDIMEVHIGTFPHVFGNNPPTAATNGKNVWVDQDYLTTLKLPEAVFLFCHEIGHAMWLHMARGKHFAEMGFDGKPFEPRRWNYAGDYVINDMLIKSNIGKMPKGGLHSAKYHHDDFVDDVYRDLEDKMPPENGGGGTDPNGNDGGTLDTHVYAPATVNEAEMKRAVQTACDAAKAMGKLPAALERYATQFLKPVVKWTDRLRHKALRSVTRDATTWTRPHRRRLVSQGLYLPAYTGFGAGFLVIAQDTSASMDQAQLNRGFSELDDILDTCHPTGVILLGCDAAVSSVHVLQAGDCLQANPPHLGGGGGTSFIPVFEWVEKNCEQPACLIYFTDLEGTFPKDEPDYPVIWCVSGGSTEHPWGELIAMEDE